MGANYSIKDIPDMSGKVIIITGANTGIGRICATEIARKGGHVICACRNKKRSMPIVEEIRKETGNEQVDFMQCDLANLESVIDFTDQFRKRGLPIDVLLNNAGIMMCPYRLTNDGIESQFGTNHVGHFLLTTRLLDIVEDSAPSRIIMLSSLAHTMTHSKGVFLSLEEINDEKHYSAVKWYGQSKLSNLLFARCLARRMADKEVYANAVHPGYVNTELVRSIGDTYNGAANVLAKIGGIVAAKSPENGSLTSLYAACSPDIEERDFRGTYFVPTAKVGKSSKFAQDEELGEQLWDFTIELIKEKIGDVVFYKGEEEEEGEEEATRKNKKKKKKGDKKRKAKKSPRKEHTLEGEAQRKEEEEDGSAKGKEKRHTKKQTPRKSKKEEEES